MDNTMALAALVGLFMPFLVSIVKQAGLNKWWNLLISAAACSIAGVLTVWLRGELHWASIATAILAVFVAAQAVYAAFWRDAFDNPINLATSFINKPEGEPVGE